MNCNDHLRFELYTLLIGTFWACYLSVNKYSVPLYNHILFVLIVQYIDDLWEFDFAIYVHFQPKCINSCNFVASIQAKQVRV